MIKRSLKYILIFFLLVFLVFTRSFAGIYIFGYRIGEFVVLAGFLSSIYFLIINRKYFDKTKLKNSITAHRYLLFSFFLVIFVNPPTSFDTYVFKSSSYFWMIGYIYLGWHLSFFINFKNLKNYISLLLIPIYFLQSNLFTNIAVIYECKNCTENDLSNFSNIILKFFTNYSDKFEPYKGTDMLIVFVISIFLLNRIKNYKFSNYIYFSFISGTYLPFFMLKSRAAAIAAAIFILYEIIILKKNYFKTKHFFIFLSIFSISILLSSSFLINKNINFSDSSTDLEILFSSRNSIEGDKPFIYIENSKIYSSDGNLNWRLQIWQETITDLQQDKKLLFGNGYNDKIPSMKLQSRLGQDGLNENVHNFLINVIARGGIFHLCLFLIFKYFLIKESNNFTNTKYLLSFFIPLLFSSLFDASFENVQFPMFYYLFIGYIFAQEEG